MPRSEDPGRGAALTITPAPQPATPDAWDVIERAQAGDPDAWTELYLRYQEQIFRFVYFRLGNRQLAEDLTQDTFVRALRTIGHWQWQGKDPAAMFITIARNLVTDHYKSARVRLDITVADTFDMDRTDTEPTPEAAVVTALTLRSVLPAMRRLHGDQARVLTLRYFYGLDIRETGEQMGLTDGAVKALCYRAVQSLRRLLPREAVEAAA